MNEIFIETLKRSGKTQYQLSKESGVPYSTINGLANRRHAINKCYAPTLISIADALGVDVRHILDRYPVMDGVCGIMDGISYEWSATDEGMKLKLVDGDVTKVLEIGYRMDIPERKAAYMAITGFKIQDYLDEKAFRARAQEIANRVGARMV